MSFDNAKAIALLVSFGTDERLATEQAIALQKLKIGLVLRDEADYPAQIKRVLKDKAPKFLFFRGNLGLGERPNLGFCGSRKASARGIGVCEEIALEAVRAGAGITAGYAAGIDQCAHKVALENGANTIVVLPEGIANFSIRKHLKECWDWERVLVVSEFLPSSKWAVGKAMQRNRTIIGMSNALVVIEAGETGGTYEAGKSGLSLGHPVFAPVYNEDSGVGPGNRILVEMGANPVMRSRTTGLAKLDKLLQQLQRRAGVDSDFI